MTILLDTEPKTVSNEIPAAETLSASLQLKRAEPIAFRQCRNGSGGSLKVRKPDHDCSWNRILTKVQSNTPQITKAPTPVSQQETKSYDRREFPRHSSEAIVLAFGKDESSLCGEGGHSGDQGYAINVSQNGISFATRSQYNLRDELQLQMEDRRMEFTLKVTASVVRATPLDDQFWRIDCKLVTPLSDQQVAHLKEYVPSCYAG